MSFLDPSQFKTALAVPTWTGTTFNMARQRDGAYIGTDLGTTDEPYTLSIGSNFNAAGTSAFSFRMSRAKNVVPAVGLPIPPDDILQASVQIKLPHRSFTPIDARNLFCTVAEFLQVQANMDRLCRGER